MNCFVIVEIADHKKVTVNVGQITYFYDYKYDNGEGTCIQLVSGDYIYTAKCVAAELRKCIGNSSQAIIASIGG